MKSEAFELASAPRWSGAPGRVEVWYATLTDPSSGVGLWLHHEIVAPTAKRAVARGAVPTAARDGNRADTPYAHGWISLFPTDSGPITARFGPHAIQPSAAGAPWFDAAGCRARPGHFSGSANDIAWDLRWTDRSAPLWTFPKALWSRQLLPGAQVLPAPTATFAGAVRVGATTYSFDSARGGVAHIYGHGNAERWGWLHADLGGGDVLELVSAVSRKAGMNRLPPLAFLRFRVDGHDWPAGVLPALLTRTRLALPYWSVEGHVAGRRVRIRVSQPPDRCVALRYVDPDGQACVCTNTARAEIWIDVERRAGAGWKIERAWHLDGTGHAEVGLRGRGAPRLNERTKRLRSP